MAGAEDDALDHWLHGEGRAALDGITGSAFDLMIVMDRDHITRYLNRTAAPHILREAVVGQRVVDLLPHDYRQSASAVYAEVLRTGVAARFETMYRDEHGTNIWEVRVGPVRVGEAVIGLVLSTCNVTELRLAAADRDRFFSLSLDMLLVGTPEGRLKRVNPAFGAALGYELAELHDKPFIELVHPEDETATLEAFGELVRGHSVTDFENRVRRKDGTHRVFSWRATIDPVTLDIYAVARDITEQRAAERQLRHALKLEAVGQLAGGVAHDFNNIVQAIVMQTELGKELAAPGSGVAELFQEIEIASKRAADLTKQLLAFGRRQPTNLEPIDLNARVRGLLTMLRRLLPENIAIELRAASGLDLVSADPTQLEQVIVNLCVNARDAMPGGGALTIETENVWMPEHAAEQQPFAAPGRFVLLRVSDTGVGMTPEVRERAFEPFFTTKGGGRGTGLGLATVYGIVRQHGGVVRVRSSPDEGTTFEVCLPADNRPVRTGEAVARVSSASGHETILVAEDEALVRAPLARLLEAAGYRVLAAEHGRHAVRLLAEHEGPVHLALLDVIMPELDGIETWAQLQRMRPDLRVLFASGYAEEHHLERLPDDAEVVAKPFRTADLLSRIRRKLDA